MKDNISTTLGIKPVITQGKSVHHSENLSLLPGQTATIKITVAPCTPNTEHGINPMSQRDKRWRDTLLGHSTYYTIGSAGCALTCAAMICSQVDGSITPDGLQQMLLPKGGFWQANLNWAIVPEVMPQIVFDGIINWMDEPADIVAVATELDLRPTILWVDFYPGGGFNTHFVVATEMLEDDIMIIDPWDGYQGRLLTRYAQDSWSLERAIYGMRKLYVGDVTGEPLSKKAGLDKILYEPKEDW